MRIYKAILKHGHSKFSLEILEYCAPENILIREQYYIDNLKPEYNILGLAGSPRGYKHTEEALEKIKSSSKGRRHSEEAKAKMRTANLGKIMSEDIKLKISNTKILASFKHTKEAKLKIGAAASARNGTITCVTNIDTGKIDQYTSQRKAAMALNIAPLTIKRHIESKKLYQGIYKITNLKS